MHRSWTVMACVWWLQLALPASEHGQQDLISLPFRKALHAETRRKVYTSVVPCMATLYPLPIHPTTPTLPMQQNKRWRHWQKWLICLPLHSSTPLPLPTVPPQRVPCYFQTPRLLVPVSPAVYHAGRHCVVHQAQQGDSHLDVTCRSVRIRVNQVIEHFHHVITYYKHCKYIARFVKIAIEALISLYTNMAAVFCFPL